MYPVGSAGVFKPETATSKPIRLTNNRAADAPMTNVTSQSTVFPAAIDRTRIDSVPANTDVTVAAANADHKSDRPAINTIPAIVNAVPTVARLTVRVSRRVSAADVVGTGAMEAGGVVVTIIRCRYFMAAADDFSIRYSPTPNPKTPPAIISHGRVSNRPSSQ